MNTMMTTQSGTGLAAKCPKIRHIVEIRQMLKQWRNKASNKTAAGDVPAGHVAVCVGSNRTRFVVRATYLNHPIFKELLAKTEEEFGFSNVGPLTIPCHETLFQEAIRVVSRSVDPASSKSRRFRVRDCQSRRCCHVDVLGMEKKTKLLDLGCESRPLLHH